MTGSSTWAGWQQQALGQDRTSAIADPLFVDWRNWDLRLQPGSPALARGFVEFQQNAQVGCLPATNPFCSLPRQGRW